MRFIASPEHVTVQGDGPPLTIPIAQWLELEPDFEHVAIADFESWTPQQHYMVIGGNQQPTTLPSRQGYCSKIELYRAAFGLEPEQISAPSQPLPRPADAMQSLMTAPIFAFAVQYAAQNVGVNLGYTNVAVMLQTRPFSPERLAGAIDRLRLALDANGTPFTQEHEDWIVNWIATHKLGLTVAE